MTAPTDHPADGVEHLDPDRWATANRALIRKAIAEFSHERLLEPVLDGPTYRLTSDDGHVEYRFAATRQALDHWHVDAASIVRTRDGRTLPPDAPAFVVEFHRTLGIDATTLPVYVEEITSTLASAAYKLAKPEVSADDLVDAGFQAVESEMTEGHPCFVATNGRLGFGVADFREYVPEAAADVRLVWLAVHVENAVVAAGSGLSYADLLLAELGAGTVDAFRARLRRTGLDPEHYVFMPAHPWQWDNKLAITFAAELAQRRIVPVGTSADTYRPQQSIRTFANASTPQRHYVKTSLSILNMGFMRGLSPAYMAVTPAINDWLSGLLAGDDVLERRGFTLLREVAAVGYHHRHLEAASDKGSPYRKMLAALWRESPVSRVAADDRLATMASLLHTDRAGRSFAAALIRRSGLPAEVWVRRYLEAYLVPLAHCLYAYDLAFMPHGENVILVLRDHVPVRVFMKDLAEEIVIVGDQVDVPDELARIRGVVPDAEKALAIFTDVFDCIFRFLGPLLDDEGLLSVAEFWALVGSCLRDYQAANPALAARFARIDLFAPEFALSCLNRLQLRDNQHMVDLENLSSSLQFAGTLRNPLASTGGNEAQVAPRTT